ncbi:MAG: GNAT family N-acetyltransferase [Clostridiaceae bacterium]
MQISIQPLSPALAQTYCDFLTHLDFANTPHWASCFCRFYHTECSMEEWMARSLEVNRAEALREIEAGRMRGYLAFDGETCVGWCNANDISQYLRLHEDAQKYCAGKRVACTICFVIHPAYRGKGIARQLLARAVSDYRAAGYDAMIALPIEAEGAGQRRYRGTLHMFQEAGYRELAVIDHLHVMWCNLQEEDPS